VLSSFLFAKKNLLSSQLTQRKVDSQIDRPLNIPSSDFRKIPEDWIYDDAGSAMV
jgi:hypothetical protein